MFINIICRSRILASRNSTTILNSRAGATLAKQNEKRIAPDQIDLLESHKLCVAQVKKYDRENYLAGLCITDPSMRRVVFAMRAFNVELALIRDSTTNADRAKLRFHFWSKLIEEIIRRNDIADTDDHKLLAYYNYTPVAKELLEICHLVDVNDTIQQKFKDLIGSRLSSKALGYRPFESMEELELYCAKSNGSLYHLSANLTTQLHNVWYSNYDIIPQVSKVADSLGVAHGLSNVIRGIPYNATRDCCYIPKDLLAEHNLTSRDFVGKSLEGNKIAPVVRTLSLRCKELVNRAYQDQRYIPNYFRLLFLPRVAIQDNLKRLKKCNYNVCDSRMREKNNLLPLNLWMASKYFRAPIL